MAIHDDDQLRAAIERCAELEAWLRLEADPQVREEITRELGEARDTLLQELARVAKEQESTFDRMFPEGNVTDFFKQLDEAAEARRAAEAIADAAMSAEPHPAELEHEAQEAVRELVRELEVPAEIRALPEWPPAYQEALDSYNGFAAGGIEHDAAPAADYADVRELEAGGEIEGEVIAIIERDGGAFYVVDDRDGRQAAVPVDDELDLEPGDDITASRDLDGDYDVGRDYGYGM